LNAFNKNAELSFDEIALVMSAKQIKQGRKMLQGIYVFLLNTAERFCLQYPLYGFVRLVYKNQFLPFWFRAGDCSFSFYDNQPFFSLLVYNP
jgi:hypothetical protein